MGNEIATQESHRKTTFIVLISILSVFIIYYGIMSMISPGRRLKEIKNEFGIKTEKNEASQQTLADSTYLKLLKEKSFLQSRIVMAQTDSIYLAINLADSSINIELCGVVVSKAKMTRIQISRILMKSDESSILSMLAKPFTISNSIATIKKEPVIFQMAPKDTSEYKPDIMPDTTITEPVNYILETDRGIRIYVYQNENAKFRDKFSRFSFDIKDRLRDTWSSLKSVAVLKVPEYHPFIKIRLPMSDAKIIFRAIPKNGQIAFFR